MDFLNNLYTKVKEVMDNWNEQSIYAVSFFVSANECYEYKDFCNVPTFAISYNTEQDCPNAGKYDEERWNYAFWRQDEHPIIDYDSPNNLTEMLFDWYSQNGIEDIGEEDEDVYNEYMEYVGKGPKGLYELLQMVTEVAKRLQEEGYLQNRFGKKIPIIIHDLECVWYNLEATKKANPKGEANDYLRAVKGWDIV